MSAQPYGLEFQLGVRSGDWHQGLGLRFELPDQAIARQARFSVTTTLGTRRRFCGRTIFVLGNETEYNFSILHQAPPMHLVALANHLEEDVRDELLTYASLQDASGAMDFNVGIFGPIRYASFYQESMFIRTLYQYVVWTGDVGFLEARVDPAAEHPLVWHDDAHPFGGTVYDHAARAAGYVMSHMFEDLVPAIDWWDGYPVESMEWRYDPRFTGQTGWRELPTLFHGPNAVAEGSMVFCEALEQLSMLAVATGRRADADRFAAQAARMRPLIRERFFNPSSGVFALMIDSDGRRQADTRDDFLAYPQVRALATRTVIDRGLLDVVRAYRMTPVGVQEARRLGPLASEWMRDIWPEKTHLYALEEFRAGRPDLAVDAVRRQLPASVHRLNPLAPTSRYPERYDPRDFRPKGWIQGGDPELIHCLLIGLAGLRPGLDGITSEPSVPPDWEECAVTFFLQGHWRRWAYRGGASILTVLR